MNTDFLFSQWYLFKKFICIDIIGLMGHLVDYGSIFIMLFGLAFVIFGLSLYVFAKRASPDRRFFRMSAYTQMVVLIVTGLMFMVIGVLSSRW